MNIVNSRLIFGEIKHQKSVLMRKINTDTRLNCGNIYLQPLVSPKCVEQPDQVSSRFALTSSFRTLQLIFLLHRPAFLQLLKTFLKIQLDLYIFGLLDPKPSSTFLYHVRFPKNLHCLQFQVCVRRVNEFNEEMC